MCDSVCLCAWLWQSIPCLWMAQQHEHAMLPSGLVCFHQPHNAHIPVRTQMLEEISFCCMAFTEAQSVVQSLWSRGSFWHLTPTVWGDTSTEIPAERHRVGYRRNVVSSVTSALWGNDRGVLLGGITGYNQGKTINKMHMGDHCVTWHEFSLDNHHCTYRIIVLNIQFLLFYFSFQCVKIGGKT